MASGVKLAVIIVAALAVIGVAGKYTGLFGNLFGGKLTIDKTANVVSEIKKISEYTTACFYEELVLKDNKFEVKETPVYKKIETGNKVRDLLGLDKEVDGVVVDSTEVGKIAIIVKGKVRAGFDLSCIDNEDLCVSGDTLSMALPNAKIFDIIVNPSDVEIFHRSGTWEDDEVAKLLSSAKDEIEKDALAYGILDKAKTAGRGKLESLFKTFGFTCVKFE